MFTTIPNLIHYTVNRMNWLWKRIIKRRHLHRVRFDQLKIGDIVRRKGAYWKVVMFNGPNKPILDKVEHPNGD